MTILLADTKMPLAPTTTFVFELPTLITPLLLMVADLPEAMVTRQSTDVFAVEDPKLKQALRFIRDHAHEGITVCDVLRKVPVARRTMERRFNELLGHSPSEEIRKTKLEKVRELLLSTDMPVPDVAEAAGFHYVEHMIPLFKKHHGLTPAAYRRQARAGGGKREEVCFMDGSCRAPRSPSGQRGVL